MDGTTVALGRLAVFMDVEGTMGQLDGEEHLDEAQLLREVASGSQEGFTRLVERHSGKLIAYLKCKTGDGHLAEDLAQEAFLRAYRAVRERGFEGRSGFKTWLYVIADNCARDYWRRVKRPATEARDCLEMQAGPGKGAEQNEEEQRLRDAILKLPEPHREVVALKFFGGLTFMEIAEVTAEPVPTLKSRLKYALARLHASLGVGMEERS